jgi:hypothetical protein
MHLGVGHVEMRAVVPMKLFQIIGYHESCVRDSPDCLGMHPNVRLFRMFVIVCWSTATTRVVKLTYLLGYL